MTLIDPHQRRVRRLGVTLLAGVLVNMAVPGTVFAQCPCDLVRADFDFTNELLVVPGDPVRRAPPGTLLLITGTDFPRSQSPFVVRFGDEVTLGHLFTPELVIVGVPPIGRQQTTVSFELGGVVLASFPFTVQRRVQVDDPAAVIQAFFDRMFAVDEVIADITTATLRDAVSQGRPIPIELVVTIENLFTLIDASRPAVEQALQRLTARERRQLASIIVASGILPLLEGLPGISNSGVHVHTSACTGLRQFGGALALTGGAIALIPGLQVFGGLKALVGGVIILAKSV